ncbi:MAG TPA: hypothetical protein VFZ90_06370 [Gemmatimonadales bacterium]
MSWNTRMRRLTTWLPWTTLLIAAVGCGGDNKSPTGPGDQGEGDNPNAIEFQLVALGRVGLPTDAQLEDCGVTRFYGGKINIDPNTGQWDIHLRVHDDESGDWGYLDSGRSVGDDETVLFESDVSGVTYNGTVNGDGTEVTIMYDWCFDGVPDVQLVFDR